MSTTFQPFAVRAVHTEATWPSEETALLATNCRSATGAPGRPATNPGSRKETVTEGPTRRGRAAFCAIDPSRAKKRERVRRVAGADAASRAWAVSAAVKGAGRPRGGRRVGGGGGENAEGCGDGERHDRRAHADGLAADGRVPVRRAVRR
ncbi:hypothetical protein ACQ4WX_41600 [Streptomyces lasalocidi]